MVFFFFLFFLVWVKVILFLFLFLKHQMLIKRLKKKIVPLAIDFFFIITQLAIDIFYSFFWAKIWIFFFFFWVEAKIWIWYILDTTYYILIQLYYTVFYSRSTLTTTPDSTESCTSFLRANFLLMSTAKFPLKKIIFPFFLLRKIM